MTNQRRADQERIQSGAFGASPAASAERLALLDQKIAEAYKALHPAAVVPDLTLSDLAARDQKAYDAATSGPLLSPAPAHGPVRNETQAIQAAKQFLKDIGEADSISVQPYPQHQDPLLAPYLRSGWVVQVKPESADAMPMRRFLLAADNGAISSIGPRMFAARNVSAGTSLTQAQLLQAAQTIFRATGNPGEFRLLDSGMPGTRSMFELIQQFHGLPYRGAPMLMSLDPHTGRITFLPALPPLSSEPSDSTLTVDRAQALAAADAALKRAGRPVGELISANLWVVTPSVMNADNEKGGLSRPAPRVAWVVRHQASNTPSGALEVWVDAGTGTILGIR